MQWWLLYACLAEVKSVTWLQFILCVHIFGSYLVLVALSPRGVRQVVFSLPHRTLPYKWDKMEREAKYGI